MKARHCFLAVFAAALLCLSAHAAEDPAFLFEIKENTDLALVEDAQTISEAAGVYVTEDYALIESLDEAGQLVRYEKDRPIYLFSLDSELMQLFAAPWNCAVTGSHHAAQLGLTGSGVNIAVIDSGIRPDFETLTGTPVSKGINCLVEEGDPAYYDTADGKGHGTMVASMISQISPRAQLVPFKCFDANGAGTVSGVVNAIYAAVDKLDCRILNLSLGQTANDKFLSEAIAHAYEQGVVIVAASGNLEDRNRTPGKDPYFYPAAYDGVIGVGGVDSKKEIGYYSVQNSSVTVTAPGSSVSGYPLSGTGTARGSGTSFATPCVAAAAALALEAEPALTPQAFTQLLIDTSEDLGDAGYDKTYGHGLLNVGLLCAVLCEDAEPAFSYYNSTLCVSAAGNGFLFSAYDHSGRSLLVQRADALNNFPLPAQTNACTFFSLDSMLTPLHAARKY